MKKLIKASKKQWKGMTRTGVDVSFNFFMVPVAVFGLLGFSVATIMLLPAILPVVGVGLILLGLKVAYNNITNK